MGKEPHEQKAAENKPWTLPSTTFPKRISPTKRISFLPSYRQARRKFKAVLKQPESQNPTHLLPPAADPLAMKMSEEESNNNQARDETIIFHFNL